MTASGLPPELEDKALRMAADFEFFARNALQIRTKTGAMVDFRLNRAQMLLHERLEEQKRKTGRVRAIVLKGRQLGASTYIQGRFYWRLWKGRGLKAFILTHEQDATDNMFGMAQRFHQNFPDTPLKPQTKAANAKELSFADNDCSYAVATAGTKGVGRSSTLQLFHGSEAGFWPNAETHIDGAFQALADAAGTERILESTANGVGNVFQRRYVAAARGDSDEEAIFIPWFWGEDYARDPGDWQPNPEWTTYGKTYGLTIEQLYWAFRKNHDMATAISEPADRPCWKFHQEYPASAELAFQTGGNSFIPAEKISAARKARIIGQGPIIFGVDPARGGGDKTGVIDRCGRRMGERVCQRWDDKDLMVVAGKCVQLLRRYPNSVMNVDVGGLGAGVYDRLCELGLSNRVNAVNFGSSPLGIGPTGDELYANRRAEMWDILRDWFDSPGGTQIPDDDVMHADLAAPVWGAGATRHGSNNELTIEPKDKIRERLGFSPDLGDAAALTMAVPYEEAVYEEQDDEPRNRGRGGY